MVTETQIPAGRILVVDDEPLVRAAIRMMLKFDGHQVEEVANGEDALALIEQGKFDLVITDYDMPALKGDALALAIRSHFPEQPIIMITASAEALRLAEKPFPGVDLVIGKPFLVQHLREAIAKTCPRPAPSGCRN